MSNTVNILAVVSTRRFWAMRRNKEQKNKNKSEVKLVCLTSAFYLFLSLICLHKQCCDLKHFFLVHWPIFSRGLKWPLEALRNRPICNTGVSEREPEED